MQQSTGMTITTTWNDPCSSEVVVKLIEGTASDWHNNASRLNGGRDNLVAINSLLESDPAPP